MATRRILASVCVVMVVAATTTYGRTNLSSVMATSHSPFEGPGGPDPISWDHLSPLTVVEQITSVGGGEYRYSYSLANVDPSPIWNFFVYTRFPTQGTAGGTLFTGHSSWSESAWVALSGMAPEYNATNLDPLIQGLTGTHNVPMLYPATVILVGESTSGFSFLAATYDPSPKYYAYETLASGWTQSNGTGKVAAVGQTIPEPATLSLLALGGLVLQRRRR